MGLDEAKVEYAIARAQILEERFDTILGAIETEREERSRMSEMREQRIIRESLEKIESGIDRLGEQLGRNIDLQFKACVADQKVEVDTLVIKVGNLEQTTAELDVRTREVPLLRGRVEHLEARPGQTAIKAWQWMAAGGVSAAGVAFGIVSWILSH